MWYQLSVRCLLKKTRQICKGELKLIALIKYTLHDYIRSHKYFPPISTFFIIILVFYNYSPNPVIDSYSVTALFLFIISTWLCISVMALDSDVQRQIAILHIKANHRYYIGKLIAVWCVMMILTIFSILFPILFNKFNEPVTLLTGFVSFSNHILLATLGIVVASLFSQVITKNVVNAYGGLAITVVISIAGIGIKDVLPEFLKPITWIIPPVSMTQKTLFDWTGEGVSDLAIFPFIWIVIYTLCLGVLFFRLIKR